MVLKIEKPLVESTAVVYDTSDADKSEVLGNFDPPLPKSASDTFHGGSIDVQVSEQKDLHTSSNLVCAGCGVSEKDAAVSLLLFDDPEDDEKENPSADLEAKRYCAECMTGKKVRVFWPVDSQWYIAEVQEYDISSGEHLLRYPDGDTEWVRIGEDHTTNTGYKEYFSSLKGEELNGLQEGISHGASFAFSALGTRSMSQGFGPLDEEVDKPVLSNESFKKHAVQQLNLNRSASSMSSFGLNDVVGGRQHSFYRDGNSRDSRAGLSSFQILSPNCTHSFSSRKGDTSMNVYPNNGRKSSTSQSKGTERDRDDDPSHQYTHHLRSENWEIYPHHSYYSHLAVKDSSRFQGRNHQPNSYDYPPYSHRDMAGGNNGGSVDASLYPNQHTSFPGHCHSQNGPVEDSHANRWVPHPPPRYPQSYYDAPPSHISPPYPVHLPSPTPSEKPQSILVATENNLINKCSVDENMKISNHQKPPQLPPTSTSDKHKKAATKAWTKEEDDHLLDMVFQMKHPLKWSIIAQTLDTNRTGKQCRERYVNHLNPRLKSSDWLPLEDFTIWRLYSTIGTQWAKMSKVIPGRTDNGIKNRFHNLKRKLDREEESRIRAPRPDNYESKVRVEWIREIPSAMRSSIEDLWSVKRGIGKIAAATFASVPSVDNTCESTDASSLVQQNGSRFGPFEIAGVPIQCLRCGLFVPSVQCGYEICSKTRWCRVCTEVPMHMGGNVLRECINLRKIQDRRFLEGMESLMNEVKL